MILFFVFSPARSIINFFVRLGIVGPFFVEALDCSFLYVPLVNEFLLVSLIGRDESNTLWIVYTLSAAAGAVVGTAMLDFVMRRAGEKGVERFIPTGKLERLKSRLEQNAGRVIFVASALPPPFPFRVTVIAASTLQCPRGRMLMSVFFGRALRFTVESILILYFGRRFLKYLRSEWVEYAVYGFTIAAIIGSAYMAYKIFWRR